MSTLAQKLPLPLMQTQWATAINPVLNFPPVSGVLLLNVVLSEGTNAINTRLGRQAQGWIITDQQAPASIYRSSSFNNLTLTLTSSAATTINLWVY